MRVHQAKTNLFCLSSLEITYLLSDNSSIAENLIIGSTLFGWEDCLYIFTEISKQNNPIKFFFDGWLCFL